MAQLLSNHPDGAAGVVFAEHDPVHASVCRKLNQGGKLLGRGADVRGEDQVFPFPLRFRPLDRLFGMAQALAQRSKGNFGKKIFVLFDEDEQGIAGSLRDDGGFFF